jgi:predicted dehydrogenase
MMHTQNENEIDPAGAPTAGPKIRPRLGFLGVGWIGRHRLEAVAQSALAQVTAIADPDNELCEAARQAAPQARLGRNLGDLLTADLDGIVIATPSALHAAQAIEALQAGMAVFCQKPLGRDARETHAVVQTALLADRLLGVDLSYRFVEGARKIRRHIQAGDIGTVYAVDLVFHNAYGPDKAWYYQPQAAGGGCVIDLGIHLVDFVLWALDFPRVTDLSSRLFAQGALLNGRRDVVEDYATARFDLDTGVTVNLACSWRLPAGRDAIIKAVFYGTEGGLCLRNVNGSFYDFKAERFHGTSRQTLQEPPDEWGGRAVVAWTGQLAQSSRFRKDVEGILQVAEVLDAIYGRL